MTPTPPPTSAAEALVEAEQDLRELCGVAEELVRGLENLRDMLRPHGLSPGLMRVEIALAGAMGARAWIAEAESVVHDAALEACAREVEEASDHAAE